MVFKFKDEKKGKLFEKVLTQIILLNAENSFFHVGNEVKFASKFDDVVIKHHQDGNKIKYTFFQLKYDDNKNPNYVIDENDLSKDGIYSLEKYFLSYLRICQEFKGTSKEIEKLILYTDIKELDSSIRKLKIKSDQYSIDTGHSDHSTYLDITKVPKLVHKLCALKSDYEKIIEYFKKVKDEPNLSVEIENSKHKDVIEYYIHSLFKKNILVLKNFIYDHNIDKEEQDLRKNVGLDKLKEEQLDNLYFRIHIDIKKRNFLNNLLNGNLGNDKKDKLFVNISNRIKKLPLNEKDKLKKLLSNILCFVGNDNSEKLELKDKLKTLCGAKEWIIVPSVLKVIQDENYAERIPEKIIIDRSHVEAFFELFEFKVGQSNLKEMDTFLKSRNPEYVQRVQNFIEKTCMNNNVETWYSTKKLQMALKEDASVFNIYLKSEVFQYELQHFQMSFNEKKLKDLGDFKEGKIAVCLIESTVPFVTVKKVQNTLTDEYNKQYMYYYLK